MKTRIAKKVLKTLNEEPLRYRGSTIHRADQRSDKWKSTKEAEAYCEALMVKLGPLGRAELGFNLAMREIERRYE